MRKTQRHGVNIFGDKSRDQRGEMSSYRSIKVRCTGVGNGLDLETGDLADGIAQFGVCDSKRDLLLSFDRVEKRGELGCDFSFHHGSSFFQCGGGGIKFLELLQLQSEAQVSRCVGDMKIMRISRGFSDK